MKKIISIFLLPLTLLLSSISTQATIVEVETSEGTFEINLYDEGAPITVANFLSYVEDEAYNNVVFHRISHGFVLQGGGFTFDGAYLEATTTKAPIENEPVYSNIQWTVAMAKTSDPDSATNQFYINLADNSTSLDIKSKSGGFSVFGEVISGFDTIAAITHARVNSSDPDSDNLVTATCDDTPIKDLTQEKCSDWTLLGTDDFFTIISVTIVDSTVDTLEGLEPELNTLVNLPSRSSSDSSGGSWSLLMLFSLMLLTWFRSVSFK